MSGTRPSHGLDDYTGEFTHPAYGSITVTRVGNDLLATVNGVVRTVTHYHYDIFEMTMEEWDLRIKLSFAGNMQGDIESISAPFEPAVPNITFKRAPSRHMTEKRFLQRFVGEYSLMGMPLRVVLKGDHALLVSLPGQPDYELVPLKSMEVPV